jgi:hypothetical protein
MRFFFVLKIWSDDFNIQKMKNFAVFTFKNPKQKGIAVNSEKKQEIAQAIQKT